MVECTLICVNPAVVERVWPNVEGMLARAYSSGASDDTIEAVRDDVLGGRTLLWIIWDGERIVAALTTKLRTTPRRKLCLIAACGGGDIGRWLHLLPGLEDYAKSENCDVIRVQGRDGWKKLLPADYREPWITLEKRLNDVR